MGAATASIIGFDVLMIVSGRIATMFAAVEDDKAWMFFIFAMATFLPIVFQLLAIFTALVWSIYPILWILVDGKPLTGNGFDADSAAWVYMIVDVIAKSGFGFVLVFSNAAAEYYSGENQSMNQGKQFWFFFCWGQKLWKG